VPVDPPGPRVALQSGFPLRGERSFAALRRGDGVVPIPAVRATMTEPPEATQSGQSIQHLHSRSPSLSGRATRLPAAHRSL